MNTYYESIDEIHTFDSMYKNVIFKNNSLVIPYLNLGVYGYHPLHQKKSDISYINFSYIVFVGVSFLKVYLDKPYIIVDNGLDGDYYFGGIYLDSTTHVFNDLKIGSKYAFLQTINISEVRSEMWDLEISFGFPNLIDKKEKESFFEHKYLPDNIRKIVD